jgi:hypothetical protein
MGCAMSAKERGYKDMSNSAEKNLEENENQAAKEIKLVILGEKLHP